MQTNVIYLNNIFNFQFCSKYVILDLPEDDFNSFRNIEGLFLGEHFLDFIVNNLQVSIPLWFVDGHFWRSGRFTYAHGCQ